METEVLGALLDAWSSGYDAVTIKNYTTSDGTPSVTMFRLPAGSVVDEAIVPNHPRPPERRVH